MSADTPTPQPSPQEVADELEQWQDELRGSTRRREGAVVVMERARYERILAALRAAQDREAELLQRAEAAERERDALRAALEDVSPATIVGRCWCKQVGIHRCQEIRVLLGIDSPRALTPSAPAGAQEGSDVA